MPQSAKNRPNRRIVYSHIDPIQPRKLGWAFGSLTPRIYLRTLAAVGGSAGDLDIPSRSWPAVSITVRRRCLARRRHIPPGSRTATRRW
jgi:hypothetical protein